MKKFANHRCEDNLIIRSQTVLFSRFSRSSDDEII